MVRVATAVTSVGQIIVDCETICPVVSLFRDQLVGLLLASCLLLESGDLML